MGRIGRTGRRSSTVLDTCWAVRVSARLASLGTASKRISYVVGCSRTNLVALLATHPAPPLVCLPLSFPRCISICTTTTLAPSILFACLLLTLHTHLNLAFGQPSASSLSHPGTTTSEFDSPLPPTKSTGLLLDFTLRQWS